MYRLIFIVIIFLLPATGFAQELPQQDLESLKRDILELRTEVNQINLNLDTSQKKFRQGIAVATLGYSVTIAGGLMLGRKNDDLGKGLLIVGGATGVTGTILMVDAFRFLNRKK